VRLDLIPLLLQLQFCEKEFLPISFTDKINSSSLSSDSKDESNIFGDDSSSVDCKEIDEDGGWFKVVGSVISSSSQGTVLPIRSLSSIRSLTSRFKRDAMTSTDTVQVPGKDMFVVSPCDIGEGLKLKSVIVERECELGDGCKINNSIIMKRTKILDKFL